MDLYIIRHAVAEPADAQRWPDDAQRPLTEHGRARFIIVARGLGRVLPRVDHVFASGYARAWESAQLLREHAGWPEPQRREALESGDERAIVRALAAFDDLDSLAIIGHEPLLSGLISLLLAEDESLVDIRLKNGSVVALRCPDVPAPGEATLRWFLTPSLAEALCDGEASRD